MRVKGNEMSKIIFLNGCGSSGKSSIAKAIQHESPELWLTFGVDTFIDMLPVTKEESYLTFIPGKNDRGPTMHVALQPAGQELFKTLPLVAEILADKGMNLIIDEVLLDEECLKTYAKYLKKYTVYYIGVFCDLSVMQERERSRQDRCIGLSNDQIDRVHQGVLNSYDFKVDTSMTSPLDAARSILSFVLITPMPKAFISLEISD